MQVRPARPADARDVLDLHVVSIRAFAPDAYGEAQVEAWATFPDTAPSYPIGEPGEYYVVAERDGEVVGFGHLKEEADEYDTEAAIQAVFVHPGSARQRVGSAVLAHLEGFARGRGFEELSSLSSLNAVGFFETAGWERVEERVYRGRGPELTMVVMRRDLG
jgi:putative acetyltransferase